jgi:leader peptidase (prepilin peptidase)/N-methyltransferase
VVLPLAAAATAAFLALAVFRLARKDPRDLLPLRWRWPLVLLAGVLAGGSSISTGEWWDAALIAVLVAFGVVLGAVDLRTKLLPNTLLLWFAAASGPLFVLGAAVSGSWPALLGAAAGGAVLFTVYFLLALISPAGMGMGDVKLAAVLGLFGGWAGYSAWIGTLLGGFLLGGLAGVVVLFLRKGSRGSTFPFGPGMLVAALAGFALLG